ncbi:MAG: fumarate reductase/succinate dehydrogenase flavoprotein subunit [Candidatus Binataceae bacterium]
MVQYETHDHDVLVIGAGGAGLRAAIEASACGARVGLVCKSLLGKAHTVMAEGGVAAALANVDDRDSWKVHFADTMRGGQYVNNWRMAELHAQEAPERVRELEAWGAVFDRTRDGRILQRNFGGHRYPRLAHVGDRTGLEMIRTLQDHGIHQGLDVFMEFTIVGLIKDGARIAGAFGYDRERGLFHLFRARAVVLGTGGIGRAFKITSNSWEYTGDGQTMAYDVGADLTDMEFVQFHPTGMVWPLSVAGILVTEGVRGEGGILVNKDGRRFMFDDIPENYRPQTADNEEEGWRYCQGDKNARRPPELLTRDHVARCIVREIKEGRGSPHDGVFLDIAWIKKRLPNAEEHIKQKLPSMYHQFMKLADIDITKVPMEVGPTTHYMMGGIRVDGDSQMSSVPGLFAAGEAAAGLHGANRLGGNSLSDLLVFGKRAGEYAAKFAKENGAVTVSQEQLEELGRRALAPFESPTGNAESPYQIQKELQQDMQELVGIVRREEEMVRALEIVDKLKERAKNVRVEGNRMYNAGWHTSIDLHNLLTVSEAITRSAIIRKESRGAHFRDDYPNKDAALGGFNVILRKTPEGMRVSMEPLRDMPAELKQIIEDQQK